MHKAPLLSFPFLSSVWIFGLAASLCHSSVCALRGAEGQGAAHEALLELGRSGFPSLPLDLPREQKDGAFQHQTGRDSLGKKHEVFSPFERESAAEGGQEAAVCARTGGHPVFDPSTTALEHLLSPTRSTSLCVLESVFPEDGHIPTKPPAIPVPNSLPQPPHPHIACSKQGRG